MYDSVLQTPDKNGRGSLSLTFKANTIVTYEIISIFTQEFYDLVLFLTNSTRGENYKFWLNILMEVFEGLYIFQPEYVQPLKYLRVLIP